MKASIMSWSVAELSLRGWWERNGLVNWVSNKGKDKGDGMGWNGCLSAAHWIL